MSFNAKELKEKYNPDGSVTYKMQQRMLDLLKVIDAICRKHNMQYWLSGGTMLGAIRHQGFIPWDDDLDIEMFHPDFEKLMRILPSELPDSIRLQWHTTDKNYFFQYAKVRDCNSEVFEHNGYDKIWREHGVWVDIFPVEPSPRWAHKLSCATLGHCYKMLRTAKDPNDVVGKVRLLAALNRNIIYPLLRAIAKVWRVDYYDFSLGTPYYIRSKKDAILPVRYVKFEDFEAPVMNKVEEALSVRFHNYMELPENPGSQNHSDDVKIW